jgi:hypothetical protein
MAAAVGMDELERLWYRPVPVENLEVEEGDILFVDLLLRGDVGYRLPHFRPDDAIRYHAVEVWRRLMRGHILYMSVLLCRVASKSAASYRLRNIRVDIRVL